jgi:hypothetical protein
MAGEFDDACVFFTRVSQADEVMKMLDPRQITALGCRVIKHPDCCVLCAANNDCDRLPVHVRCRCKPEGYLTIEDANLYHA